MRTAFRIEAMWQGVIETFHVFSSFYIVQQLNLEKGINSVRRAGPVILAGTA